MTHLNLIFWQNILSDHLSEFIKVLAKRPNITVYFAYEDSKQRGWSVPDFGRATVLDVRQSHNYNALLNLNQSHDIHFLSGYFSYPIAWKAFYHIRQTQARICIISEAFNFLGWSGWLRLNRARYQTRRWGKDIDAILAMGELGTSFFQAAGLPSEKIHEFAYFVSGNQVKPLPKPHVRFHDHDETLRLLFVGQHIYRKGIDLLLRGLAKCDVPTTNLQLDIIGTGKLLPTLEQLVAKLNLTKHVNFLGGQSNDRTLAYMAQADLLVLPSRWDGWGAVISESLMQGTPVLCSDACGAASLINTASYGAVFKRSQLEDLTAKLNAQLNKGKVSMEQRHSLKNWATCLNPSRSVDYLLKIIQDILHQDTQTTSQPLELLPPWHSRCANPLGDLSKL